MSITSSKFIFRSVLVGACAIACLAIVAQGQYNNYDSDSNSELGKLVRNSGRVQAQNQRLNQQAAAAIAAATRNLHNQQQPLQYAPTQNRRNFGSSSSSAMNSGYSPVMGVQPRGSHSNSEINEDDEGSSYGPNFNSNLDGANNNDDEGSNINGDGKVTNLNQAASGYPAQGDYNNDNSGASGFNFDGANFGPSSADGSDFGPSEFGSEGKRAKSASSPMSSRNYGSSEDDAGAPQYGPNSAINADGEEVVDGRAGYAPQQDNDNDSDDE